MSSPQAGWYQDPQDPQGLRYWDGAQWTSQTHQPNPPAAPSLGSYQAPPQAPGVPAYQGYSAAQQGSYAAEPVSFTEAAKGLITKWTFRGRASRSEYWFSSLALSLHAPNDELRDQIVPINRKYPIKEVLASVNDYLESLPDNRVVTIEYLLISGINDHRQHARELAELLRWVPCKINLIPFNPFDGSDYQRSSNNAISTFRKLLQEAGYTVTIRTTRGDEIGAACGQLVGQVDDKTRRNARHLAQRAKAADEALSQPVTLV